MATAQWRVYTDRGRELLGKGRASDAESFLVRALATAREGFGEDEPHVASACNNLAELYRLQQRHAEAEPLYREVCRCISGGRVLNGSKK